MKFFIALISLAVLSSCVDKWPGMVREAGRQGERVVYGAMANENDVEAQYKYAELSCCGGDRPLRDSVRALNSFCEAAKNGQFDAMVMVGNLYSHRIYHKGSAIPMDKALAYTYYAKADELGNPDAAALKREMFNHMTDDDFARATIYQQNFDRAPCEITR
jgi:TPR repeat protein